MKRHVIFFSLARCLDDAHPTPQIIRRVRESLDYVDELDPKTAAIVRSSYAYGIHITLWFAVGMSVCAFIFSFFIREKPLSAPDAK